MFSQPTRAHMMFQLSTFKRQSAERHIRETFRFPSRSRPMGNRDQSGRFACCAYGSRDDETDEAVDISCHRRGQSNRQVPRKRRSGAFLSRNPRPAGREPSFQPRIYAGRIKNRSSQRNLAANLRWSMSEGVLAISNRRSHASRCRCPRAQVIGSARVPSRSRRIVVTQSWLAGEPNIKAGGTLWVVDLQQNAVVGTVTGVGNEPYLMAITD